MGRIRIYADFNSCGERGGVMLNTVGSLRDLEKYKASIKEGENVVFYVPGEFEINGTLMFEDIWKGVPDWSTLLYESLTSER
jgi:hypothetical protein